MKLSLAPITLRTAIARLARISTLAPALASVSAPASAAPAPSLAISDDVAAALQQLEARYPRAIDKMPAIDKSTGELVLSPGLTDGPLRLAAAPVRKRQLIFASAVVAENRGSAHAPVYDIYIPDPVSIEDDDALKCFASLPNPDPSAEFSHPEWVVRVKKMRQPDTRGAAALRAVSRTAAWPHVSGGTFGDVADAARRNLAQFEPVRDCLLESGVVVPASAGREFYLAVRWDKSPDLPDKYAASRIVQSDRWFSVVSEHTEKGKGNLAAAWEVRDKSPTDGIRIGAGEALREDHWLLVQHPGTQDSSATYDRNGRLLYAVIDLPSGRVGVPAGTVYAQYDADGSLSSYGSMKVESMREPGKRGAHSWYGVWGRKLGQPLKGHKDGVWAYRQPDGTTRLRLHTTRGSVEEQISWQTFHTMRSDNYIEDTTQELNQTITSTVCGEVARGRFGFGDIPAWSLKALAEQKTLLCTDVFKPLSAQARDSAQTGITLVDGTRVLGTPEDARSGLRDGVRRYCEATFPDECYAARKSGTTTHEVSAEQCEQVIQRLCR